MVRAIALAACVAALMGAPVRADDAGKDLLARAVKAQSADKAAGLELANAKLKATLMEGGMELTMTADLSVQGFDRIRLDLTMMVGGRNEQILVVINGDKGWAHNAGRGETKDAPEGELPVIQQFYSAIRMGSSPAVLAAAKDVTLTHGGEARFNDTAAEILRVTRKNRSDISIYYDKKTALPIKSETVIKQPNGEEMTWVFHFSDFKDAGGLKHFGKVKVVRGDKDLIEIEVAEVKGSAKFEKNTFEKP